MEGKIVSRFEEYLNGIEIVRSVEGKIVSRLEEYLNECSV